MPLILAPLHKELTIYKVSVDDSKVKKHLESLGILVGSKIELFQVTDGNIILHIGSSSLAIDKNIARQIHVY